LLDKAAQEHEYMTFSLQDIDAMEKRRFMG
jgi:hypothetical protein